MMLPLKDLWESMEITDSARFIRAVKAIRANQAHYDAVAEFSRIPWQIVAVLHTRAHTADPR